MVYVKSKPKGIHSIQMRIRLWLNYPHTQMLASKFRKCKSLELKMFLNIGGYIFFKILLKTANFTHFNVLLI